LYLWLTLGETVDFLDVFVETGILGAPGTLFGDEAEHEYWK